jgi:acid phosphatase family membrane protein YuiD
MSIISALPLPAPFLVPMLTWFIAQSLKVIIARVRGQHSLATYMAPGGVPSVHSSVVASLVVVVGLTAGWNSPALAISVVIAGLTLFDALVTRPLDGLQSEMINKFQKKLFSAEHYEKLKEIVGHRPSEIIFGLILGIILGLVFTPTSI